MPVQIVNKCSNALSELGLTVAFAESATAGRLAAEFSLTSTSGKVLKGGVVCYDAGVKKSLLKVSGQLINRYSPESAEVTQAMALGLKEVIEADIHLAITGLVSPGGSENANKPVGTIFLHGLFKENQFQERFVFAGNPEEIVLSAIAWTSKLILDRVVMPVRKENSNRQQVHRQSIIVGGLNQSGIHISTQPPS